MARPRTIPVATAIKDETDAKTHQDVGSTDQAESKEGRKDQTEEEKALAAETAVRDTRILNLAPKMTEDQLGIAMNDPLISNEAKARLKQRVDTLTRVDQKIPDPPPGIPSVPKVSEVTAMCLKTTTKFIAGSWRYLVKGKTITAPMVIIESLRNGRFVK